MGVRDNTSTRDRSFIVIGQSQSMGYHEGHLEVNLGLLEVIAGQLKMNVLVVLLLLRRRKCRS
jgi:hypothetical protein